MFKSEIEKRVMAVIKEKIANTQKQYDEEMNTLVSNHKITVFNLEQELEGNKEVLLETHVNKILSKIL